jgi:hypothetical protein
MSTYLDSQELEWKHVTLSLLGTTIRGLRGFKIKKSKETEHLFAAGEEAVGIQTGNIKRDGSYKILKSDYDKLNDAAIQAGYEDITEVPYQLITSTIAYRKAFNRPLRTISVLGHQFTDIEEAMEQGAKMMEVELPWIAMRYKRG